MSSDRTITELQQDFALSSGLRSEIIWDILSPDQSEILKQKLVQLFPDEGNKKFDRLRETVYASVWQQRKYTNNNLFSAIIYVLVTDAIESEALQSKKFSIHPVIRTKKCMSENNNSRNCCMIFIDDHGRVYKNWDHYLLQNMLPSGIMVAPAKGVYSFNDNDEVILEKHYTPASFTSSKLARAADVGATLIGVAAGVPLVASAAFTVAGPLLVASTAATVVTAAYSSLRSLMTLRNRSYHEQSIAVTNREARKEWLGVAAGAVGLGATCSTQVLRFASSANKNVRVAKTIVNGINVTSIVVSGTGAVCGVLDIFTKISDKEEITSLDLLYLSSSLLIFTHSVNNFKLVSKISTRTRSTLRRTLTRQLRRNYQHISNGRNTSMDILRLANEIPERATLLSLHELFPNISVRSAVSTGGAMLLHRLSTGARELNLWMIAEEFGNNFMQHINDFLSFMDILNAMAQYFCERTCRFLMNLAKTFIDELSNNIQIILNTAISTEHIVYKIVMHCISNYRDISYEFLDNKTAEILNQIENYFRSYNPVHFNSAQLVCKQCNGFYYITTKTNL